MGGGTKKTIIKRQKTKAWVCSRNAKIVTTAVSQRFMTLVGSGSGEVHIPFLGQSQAEGKHNKGKAHTKLFAEFMYTDCLVLLGLSIVTARLT